MRSFLDRFLGSRVAMATAARLPGISGDYQGWEAASADSGGYDADLILEKVTASLLAVKRGEAAYERDSVTFDQTQYAWPLLSGLLWAAARDGGHLNVVDFGGSLGTTYFQNRRFLAELPSVRWSVVEQAAFVAAGREHFATGELAFHGDLAECAAQTGAKTIVLSGVLQYLPDPYGLLDEVLRLGFETVIVDRTSFRDADRDRLAVQRVPSEIFDASYPMWILSRERFLRTFRECEIIAEFPGFADSDSDWPCDFRGFLIRVPARRS